MILVFDAGNTRLKWGLTGPQGSWCAQGVCDYANLADWPAGWPRDAKPLQAVGVNVAGREQGERILQCLEAEGIPTRFIHAGATACGVTNHYRDPARLGADRWAAMIAARALHPAPALVVCAGTATTIDCLDAEGGFQGGLILPGFELMRSSLARGTAGLPLAYSPLVAWPRSTDEAIVAGCLAAQAGAAWRMWQQMGDTPDRLCIVSGGGAAQLLVHLPTPCREIPDLVLQGVRRLVEAG